MNVHSNARHLASMLAAATALATAAAFAAPATTEAAQADRPIVLAQAAPATARATREDPAPAYPPLEMGVRRAAAQGPDALRQYVWRTRMIYNYYLPNFAASN